MPDTKTKESSPEVSLNLRELSDRSTDLKVGQKLILLKTELLTTIDLFKTIPPDILQIIVKESTDIYLPKDTVLFEEGDTDLKSMLVILSGRLLVYKSKKNISELGAGEYVGEMPLIDYRPRSASVKTLEDTLLLEIKENLFRKHIAPNSSALLAMMRVFAGRTREDLTQMEKEMRRLSNFTHDMRNCLVPLGTAEIMLSSVLEILYGTQPHHKKRDGWQEVQKGFSTMMAVRNNLITMIDQSLACITKTQSEYVKSDFDLVALVEETLEEIACHKNLKKKILDIQKPDVPVVASINYLDIKRVLQNLIINAGYATEKSKKITVSIQPLDDWAEISVEDQGAGVPDDVKPLLLRDNYTSKPDGHGFGLMSCKAIIENHHQGEIGFESEWGRGTRFFFRLHLKQ
jgi:signal transduction histidine kinase